MGFKPMTFRTGIRRSIQLSYRARENSEVATTMALRANCIPKIECKITKKKLKRTIINLYIVNIKIF